MTCLLAIESNKLDDVVLVDESILKGYGSSIYIQVGEELTLRDLLYGLMLRSGNDAALMISNFLSGSEEEFAVLMNKKAKEIGMVNTVFNNSSGLDEEDGNYSTSYDMAILTSYAMGYKEYRDIVSTKKYTLKTNYKSYIWYNKNKLLDLDYITGGKTGYTKKAKRTLVSTAYYDNMNFVVVTLNDSDDWNTHKDLYEYAFSNYKSYKVLSKSGYSVLDDDYYNNNLYIDSDVYITLKSNEMDMLSNHIILNRISDYKDKDVVGKNNIYLGDVLLKSSNIYVYKEKVKKISFFKRLWEGLKFW